MADLFDALRAIVGAEHVVVGDAISDDYAHDEALTATPQLPVAVVVPSDTAQVAAVLQLADDLGVPVTARGSGTGLSGACTPAVDGIVVSFERMNRVLEIDEENHVAVVQPGVTLAELDAALAPHRLVYPGVPRRVQREPRRQRRHQRGRDARGEVRSDPPSRDRPRGGARLG